LKRTRKVGLGQLAMRGREYVVSLKPCGRGMVLETLRYADEVNKAQGYFRDIPDDAPDPELLGLAESADREEGLEVRSQGIPRSLCRCAARTLIERKKKAQGQEDHRGEGGGRRRPRLERGRPDGGAQEVAGEARSQGEQGGEDQAGRRSGEEARLMPTDPLEKYNAKRDFAKTAEPEGRIAPGKGRRFMVQKHDATRLHWDFRLEIDGVLKSWAVTRGPSLDPDEKRLAVRTEDHPLSYADFEGTIPKGEYGGGTVMLWDDGQWAPIRARAPRTWRRGHLHFTLEGERMKGEWLLIRLKPRGKEKGENWLLRKIDDGFAGATDALVETALTSVKTGRTMQEIAEGVKGKVGGEETGRREEPRLPEAAARDAGRRGAPGNQWLHEVKYDGYRALLSIGAGGAKVYTRTGLDWTDRFPGIAEAAGSLSGPALIDGEIVAFKDGKPDFSSCRKRCRAAARG
jgi:DNA ligase D-like protein (predicted 3'-phosphoesterase)